MDDLGPMALDAAVCHGNAIRTDPVPPRALSHFRREKSNEVDDPDAGENASCETDGQPGSQSGVGSSSRPGRPSSTPCMSPPKLIIMIIP